MLKIFDLYPPLSSYRFSMFTIQSGVFLKSVSKKKGGIRSENLSKSKKKKREDKELACFKCNHKLTSASRKIDVSGKHSHYFTNPAGEKFDLRCFSEAPGCKIQGVPIADLSWFPEYKWTFAFCSNCSVQSGWFYLSRNESFFGLIRESFIGEY